METTPSNKIMPDDVRATLAHIVQSAMFCNSPQLIKFIQYVVDASLDGKAEKLKAYAIGVDVLGRSEDFDPQIDPIVRVEARRLRQAIESFYAGPGANEPIRIEIPLGSYAPVFHRRLPGPDQLHQDSQAKRQARRLAVPANGTVVFLSLLATVCATVIILYLLLDQRDDAKTLAGPNTVRAGAISDLRNNGMPTLYVDRARLFARDKKGSKIGSNLRRDLLDVFSRFDAINISSLSIGRGVSTIAAARSGPSQARFVLKSNITDGSGGTVDISFRLTDADEQELVWSKDFDVDRSALTQDGTEMKIAASVGAKLLEPYGVIRAYERRKAMDGAALDPRYVCILDTFDAFLSFDKNKLVKVRGCLEKLEGPGDVFAVGLPYLAVVYNRQYLFGDESAAGHQTAIDLALETARRGVEYSPASARAYQSLLVVLFNHKDIDEAFQAGRRALELNPYDPSLFCEYGGRLILNGDIDHGLSIMQKGYTNEPVRPTMYHYFMFLGYYFKGNFVEAKHHADQLPATYPLRYFALTLMAIANKNGVLARESYDHLSQVQPRFAKNPRGWLTMFFTDQTLIDRIMTEFTNAKLVTGTGKKHI